MKTLDVASLPLKGTHLIEASAGTGKTFTLARLYLRLIVERGLSVEQILVVTFTRAAVQELRTRLRQSIVSAREALTCPDKADPELLQLLQPYTETPGLAERLEEAQLSMDQAAISTIHTFCTQLLSDNAFESGQLFDMQVDNRDDELQLQAVQEYWRKHYVPLSGEPAHWVHQNFGTPEALLSAMKPLLGANPPTLLPAGDAESYQKKKQYVEDRWNTLCEHWNNDGAEIRALIDGSPALNGNKVQTRTVAKAADWLNAQCQRGVVPSKFPESPMKVFRDSHLCSSVKKGKSAPEHVFFKRVDELWDLLEPLSALRMVTALEDCARYAERWLQEQKATLRLMSYEDLLLYAAKALEGEGSEALVERLREKFPAALIDEFQDTDPRQYGMFSALYTAQEELAWYMIGDPKQAIYSFRGADINTYLRAAAESKNQHTLGTNWRSTTAMVAVVNALFENTERPFAMQGESENSVEFHAVEASGSADDESLRLHGVEQKPLRLALLEADDSGKALAKQQAGVQAAEQTAALISEQLQAGQQGTLCLGERPLLPVDIAVLVRTNNQGNLIYNALRKHGIASVIVTKDSIFSTFEARNISRLLQLLEQPRAERWMLRVLASDLCGFEPDELIHLQASDADWQRHVEVFSDLAVLLKRQGVLAVLLSLMAEYKTASRLQSTIGGERLLSNYLQLGELLQDAWQEQPDLKNLQAWMQRHCDDPSAAGEAAQLRLETDEKLVQILTVHKSKGLEYPVVYLPFVWEARKPKSSDRVEYYSKDGRYMDFGSDQLSKNRERMQAETLAEDVRLLYVALTRASAHCTVMWGDITDAGLTAMARLLNQSGQKVEQGFGSVFCDWVEDNEHAEQVSTLDAGSFLNKSEHIILQARSCQRPPRPSWKISSYSALVRHASGHAERPDYDAADVVTGADEPPEKDPNSIMFFPRGAQAGTCMHCLFEHADFTQVHSAAFDQQVVDSLAAHGYADIWRTAVVSMMQQVLETPLLPVAGLRLCDLSAQDRLNEMGFHFPVPSLECHALLSLLRKYCVLGENEHLDFDTVRGYMTGFVDLIFRHEGRYYVLDYKSNHLGYSPEDYHPQALQSAMQEHRYDLQYLMYTVALHRYLATRISDYHYEQHMGGSFYLFLRGMRAEASSALGVYHDKPSLELIEALDDLFSAPTEPVQ